MTLGELLTLLRRAILNDRTTRTAGSSDYLWDDDTLVIYINEAQRRFAVQGLVLRDSTTDEVTKITLVAGQSIYPVHEAVVAVLTAKIEGQDPDLVRIGHEVLAAYRAPSDNWIDPNYLNGVQPGPTLAYSTDEGLQDFDTDSLSQIALRVHPVPTAAQAGQVIRLRTIRKPLNPFTTTGTSAVPEIPEDHHIEMLDYAAYLALRIIDDDAGSPTRAAEFRTSFEGHVENARNLVLQKLFAPVGWGFGRGGFSWGR